jgi:hypothetical protein
VATNDALVLTIVLLGGCSTHEPKVEPAAPSAGSDRPRAALVVDHITLLEPEDLIAKRLPDVDAFSGVLKRVTDTVIAFDGAHPDALPADLDAIVALRPSKMHVWLVGAAGDITIPELDAALAALATVAVREGAVAAVITIARPGTPRAKPGPYMPSSWKRAAGSGKDVDAVIETTWPAR